MRSFEPVNTFTQELDDTGLQRSFFSFHPRHGARAYLSTKRCKDRSLKGRHSPQAAALEMGAVIR